MFIRARWKQRFLLLSQEGGVESGFKSARSRTGPVTHLYQVKGKKNIRAREVELSWGSFNKGDCFILDVGEVCAFVYVCLCV